MRPELLTSFSARLADGERLALEAAIDAAREEGASLFLAGGAVRDVILARPILDIDIAVEGDVSELARALAGATGRRVVEHGRFGTATLRGDGFSIDFARTRRETYSRPGALPEVEPAGIQEDLARRDFTINAMALRLTDPAGELLDPFRGERDLQGGLVRVLHERSFQDDATRLVRATRYAARLGYALEARTRELVRRDLGYLESITGSRLRAEMTRAFREASGPAAARLMEEMGILRHIHPLLGLPHDEPGRRAGELVSAWTAAVEDVHPAPAEELGYCLLSGAQTDDEAGSISTRLHLTGRVERALVDLVRLRQASDKLNRRDTRPSETVELLERFAPAAVWAFGLRSGGSVEERCLAFLVTWRRVRPALNGFDLERLGVTGPEAGRALRRLRQARLDGQAESRPEEEAIVRREFGGRSE